MQLVVSKTSNLSGKAVIPGSKSHGIRGLFFALLAKGKSVLSNLLESDDTQTAIAVCQALGAQIVSNGDPLTLTSNGLPFSKIESIHTGNSGLTTLFTLPLLGLRENHANPVFINCGEQMRTRPVKSLINALRILGMHIQYLEQEEQFPVLVSGQLNGGNVEIEGTTSQYLSALLISLPCALNDSVITVRNLYERPYTEMTLAWLDQQGIYYEHQQTETVDVFSIKGGQRYHSFQTTITGDFSSASYLLAAACLLPGETELYGLDMNDAQGDKQLITLLQTMGADIVIDEKKIKIKGGQPLHAISIDTNTIPDLLPVLAVIATQAAGKTEIYNVKQARIKETDRIHSMVEGLTRMGAKIEEHTEGMTIYPSALQGALVEGYGDHRTVMALAVAGMLAEGKTVITDGEAITKTYPGFVETMKSLGACIDLSIFTGLPRASCARNDGSRKKLSCIEDKHIILMGFKHVGKTFIGKQLATELNKKFIDVDDKIEKSYEKQHAQFLTCREIMQLHGESFFRKQEQGVLEKILQMPSAVIALGGGTLLNPGNQEKVKLHHLLHITAPRGIVFERIMVSGCPAFFDSDADPYESFSRLWEERDAIYKKLSSYTIDNSESLDHAIHQAKTYLKSIAKPL